MQGVIEAVLLGHVQLFSGVFQVKSHPTSQHPDRLRIEDSKPVPFRSTPYAASRVELKREYTCVLSGLRIFLWAEIYCGFGRLR